MKQSLFLLLTAFFFLFGEHSYAATPTPGKTLGEEVIELKDRVASRVAQLKLVEKRGIVGTVTNVTNTQLTVTDIRNNTRFINVDELTQFSSPSAKESFGISDITKGINLGVLGLYNKQSETIMARFIEVVTMPKRLHGVVVGVDSDEFVVTVVGEKGEKTTVDVETVTKTSMYGKEKGLEKAGFSKISEGVRIMVVGFPDKKEKRRMVATRIIVFSDIPKNPEIIVPEEILIPQETTTPSTGSGKKLTPITR